MTEDGNTEGVNVNGGVLENPPEDDSVQAAGKGRKRGGGGTKKADPMKKRVRIKLANGAHIPPTGQFIGLNGYGYLLKPGKEADVPEPLLDILDNAVEEKPVMGEDGRVEAYESAPRFPYTVVRS